VKQNKKGFTLAELLIVVAIIGVLVAISIPIFNNQLRKARLATNQANARAAYAAVVAEYISEGAPQPTNKWYFRYGVSTGKVTSLDHDDHHLGQWLAGSGTNIESWPDYPKIENDEIYKHIKPLYNGIVRRWTFKFNNDGSIQFIWWDL
jgi:prepilin-type N-terminal cleavage/methylation domain-containing protein